MSRLQFEFLHAHLTFKDIDTREERWEHDRFAAMREFLEQCNINFGKALVPEDYISLDVHACITHTFISENEPVNPISTTSMELLITSSIL